MGIYDREYYKSDFEKTPKTSYSAPAGFKSGPKIFIIVLTPKTFLTGAAKRIAE